MRGRKLPAIALHVCLCFCKYVCLGLVGVVAFLVRGKHTQSCIRLSGETNPVTVSGNLSALMRYNLDFTETVTLVTKSVVL